MASIAIRWLGLSSVLCWTWLKFEMMNKSYKSLHFPWPFHSFKKEKKNQLSNDVCCHRTLSIRHLTLLSTVKIDWYQSSSCQQLKQMILMHPLSFTEVSITFVNSHKYAFIFWILICLFYVKYPWRTSENQNLTKIKGLADIQVQSDLKWQTVDHQPWLWLQPFRTLKGLQTQIPLLLWSFSKLLYTSK